MWKADLARAGPVRAGRPVPEHGPRVSSNDRFLMRFLLLPLLALTLPVAGKENPYDVVSKVLTPFAQVLAQSSKTSNRAMTLSFHAERTRDGTETKTVPVQVWLE